jgi:hypothetical protein
MDITFTQQAMRRIGPIQGRQIPNYKRLEKLSLAPSRMTIMAQLKKYMSSNTMAKKHLS